MQIIKYFILFLILVFSSMIGKFISKRYVYRLQELEEMKNTLNILKNKIKFTYEPIPDIFKEISNNSNKNIGQIFKKAEEKILNKNKELEKQLIEKDKEIAYLKGKIDVMKDFINELKNTDIEYGSIETQLLEKN